DIPVLFITAMDEVESKAAAFEVGAVDYITKPFEILEVKARVKTHLSLKLARETLLKQRDMMKQSLDLAMEVQQSLLPGADPNVRGLDIAGKSIYCDETGGDYYDYLDMGAWEQGRVRVVVGDVSDHGIPSALLMTTARAFLRQRSSMTGCIGEIVSDVNVQLSRDVGDSGSYMTLFFCEFDGPGRCMRWVRAGHDPAMFYDPAADAFESLRGEGMALGVNEHWRCRENEKRGLARGQVILLCTDGVWEARNPNGEMFGKEAIRETIRQNAAKDAKEMLNAIIRDLNHFQEGVPPEDDVTLVIIKIK
ncbi:MAG: SpoIIE family protein phosphatase, partial [Desulfobacterales bacterium]|nr:SpoIIE family protein phosphatase [Desulfobacterales bacterium]